MEMLMRPPGVRSVIKKATLLQESTKCSVKSSQKMKSKEPSAIPLLIGQPLHITYPKAVSDNKCFLSGRLQQFDAV